MLAASGGAGGGGAQAPTRSQGGDTGAGWWRPSVSPGREGGREGTHPGALHGILQGTHPVVLGVYQGTLYVVLHTLYTSRVMRHSYTQL